MPALTVWVPYCGAAPAPGELLARWNLDPLLLAGLALAAWLCWRRGGRGATAASVALAVLLFVSPLCALTSALFSARTVHHLLLTAALAPLLVEALMHRSAPSIPLPHREGPGVGGSGRGSMPRPEPLLSHLGAQTRAPTPNPSLAGRGARTARPHLTIWTAAFALAFWLWHAPPLYAWALSGDLAYWLMQASLLGASAGFWAAVRSASAPAGVAALLATTVQMGLLGALLTFAPMPLYAPHALATAAWGLTALEDQQLAGLIMWAPGAAIYLLAALVLGARLLRPEPRWSAP